MPSEGRAYLRDIPPAAEGYCGHVYVIGFADYVKIGWSENVARRLFEIQKYAPEELVLYKFIPANAETEGQLHRRFSHLRLYGEWFALFGGLKDWIEGGCPMPVPCY